MCPETTECVLEEGENFTQTSFEGHSCDHAWPYYRIVTGDTAYNIAIGWPGSWQSWFEKASDGFRIGAKQEDTNFYLKPGEIARSPRMVVMALKGDFDRAVNMWRRWYFAHCLNRSQGNPLGAKSCYVHTGGGDEFTLADEENQLGAISTEKTCTGSADASDTVSARRQNVPRNARKLRDRAERYENHLHRAY